MYKKINNLNKKPNMSDGSFVVDDYTKREAQAFLAGARYGIKLANDTISIDTISIIPKMPKNFKYKFKFIKCVKEQLDRLEFKMRDIMFKYAQEEGK